MAFRNFKKTDLHFILFSFKDGKICISMFNVLQFLAKLDLASRTTYLFLFIFTYLIGVGDHILATFRLQSEDDFENEFSVLSTRLKFEGRKFSKCACSELKTHTRSRPQSYSNLKVANDCFNSTRLDTVWYLDLIRPGDKST